MSEQARITVVESICHQLSGDQPVAAVTRFARSIASGEEPFARRLEVGEAWRRLETGWLESCSMLHIENLEDWYERNPDAAGAKASSEKVVELAFGDGEGLASCWVIRPGESFRGSPSSIKALWVRCRKGIARCRIHVFPE